MADHDLNILIKAKGALQAARDIGKVDSAVGSLSKTATRGIRTAARNTAVIGAGIGAAIGVGVKQGIESLADLEDGITSVNGAIDQVGPNWHTTGADIARIANDIERNVDAAFDDKDIVSGTASLIRYGKVAEGNLPQAMEIMTDLAARTGDVGSASNLLAKALADPTKAAGKLSRAGIVLTKEQQKQIKAMTKAGDTAGAQAVLLDALEQSTRGAAKAAAGPYRDALNILDDVSEDAKRGLAEGFLPVLKDVASLLSSELAKPSTMANIREFGKGLAGGLKDLISIAKQLPWGAIGDSLKVAGAGAKTVLGAFASLPPWVQTAVLTGWGLNKLTGGALGSIVTQLGSGLIKGVLGMNAGVVNIKAGVVNGGAPGAGAPGAPGKSGGIGGTVTAILGATAILGIGYAVGEAISDSLGGDLKDTERGVGRTVAEIGGVKVQLGRNEAAIVRAESSARQASSMERAAQAKTALAAQRAGERTAGAIRAKDLSVKVTSVANVRVNTKVTASGIRNASTYNARYASVGTSQSGSGTLGNGGR